jgi:hypothetical protein
MDKKAAAGELRFVFLEGPGRAALRPVDARTVIPTIRAFVSERRASAS